MYVLLYLFLQLLNYIYFLPLRNAAEISQITPITAPYYSFHTFTSTPIVVASASQLPSTATLLSSVTALAELLEKGCTLATKPWVDNHWAMVLWKLAGMVCLDPEGERWAREKVVLG